MHNVTVNVWLDPVFASDVAAESLRSVDSSVNWELCENVHDSELAIYSSSTEVAPHVQHLVVDSIDHLDSQLNLLIKEGEIILPTEMGCQAVLAMLAAEQVAVNELRRHKPKHLETSQQSPAEVVSDTIKMSAWSLHPKVLGQKLPDVKEICDKRFMNSLQREIPAYRALVPVDVSLEEFYPAIPKNVREHLAAVSSCASDIEDLGIKVPKTDMSKNQINLGIPFPGGENRTVQGLISPTPLFKECAQHVANIMLRGAAYAYRDDPVAFEESNVRIGVKKDNFQGVPLASKSHALRQVLWAIAERSKDGLYFFKKYNFPTLAGFRRQSNSGKCRVSFTLKDIGIVDRARVLDALDLLGKDIQHYTRDITAPEMLTDSGVEGARCRIVDNLWSGQNDFTLGVPAYIAAYKDYHYKAIFQQDLETFKRFIPGTSEFVAFWTEGYNDNEWVRKLAAERGCHSLEELLAKMEELGEHIICGDVENFDGNASWEVTKVFFEILMSPKVLEMVDHMWNADKLGVYASTDGSPVYYYIACQPDEQMSKEFNSLATKTRDLMSHVPSGMGPTAQAGRGVVPTALLEIIINVYPQAKPYLLTLPATQGGIFSGTSALMNSAGDDHSMGSLLLWLITGIHPNKIMNEVLEYLPNYKVMKILPEFPKMNAGWLFHEDEKGRLTHITLSPGRCFGNTVFPERPRSAIGLYSSLTKYAQSALDSPIEQDMLDLVNIILTKIYKFEDMDHLASIAAREEIWMEDNADNLPAVDRLATLLGLTVNDLAWKYTLDELVEMGAPAYLLNEFRRPIPSSLTKGPMNFLNGKSIISLSKQL